MNRTAALTLATAVVFACADARATTCEPLREFATLTIESVAIDGVDAAVATYQPAAIRAGSGPTDAVTLSVNGQSLNYWPMR